MSIDMIGTSQALSRFVMGQATTFASNHGMTWHAVPDAPNTWEELYYAYASAKKRGVYFPVSSLHSDNSIYTTPEVNHACRYWHDMLHCVHGLDFSPASELQVGRIQADCAARHFGKGSPEHMLMLADTVGQSIYDSIHGKFPDNQREFCLAWVEAHK